jgi:predicted Zn-dependent protease
MIRKAGIMRAAAILFNKMGRREDANVIFEMIMQRFPNDRSAAPFVAKHLSRRGDQNRAAELYKQIVRQMPSKRKYWKRLISALRATGNELEAAEWERTYHLATEGRRRPSKSFSFE